MSLIREYADQVVKGAEYLMQASAADAGIIAVESDKHEAIATMQNRCKRHLHIRLLAAKCPAGDERMLIKSLTGEEITDSAHPAERGILVQNVNSKSRLDAVKLGQPSISRIVTVAGAPLKTPKNFSALLGTPVSDLSWCGFEHESHGEEQSAHLQHTDQSKIIVGGFADGRRADMFLESVEQTTTCVIALIRSISQHQAGTCLYSVRILRRRLPGGSAAQQLLLYRRNW